MPTRRQRTLIVGLIMTFAGPALGFIVREIMGAHILWQAQQPLTPSLADAMNHYDALMGKIFSASVPFELGMICGAVGIIISTATLALHFWPEGIATVPYSPPVPQAPSKPRPATRPIPSDSKYMPRYSYGPNP